MQARIRRIFLDGYDVWGYEPLVKQDTPDKLQQRSIKCIFIGYPKETIEVSGRAGDLEEIQDKDTSPSGNTSEIPIEVKGFEPLYEEKAHVCRSARTHRSPERLCLNVEAEEHSLGNLNEPANYKAVILLGVDGFLRKRLTWMAMYTPIKLVLWQRDLLNSKGLIMKKHSHLLMTLAVFYDYEIWQMDVKTAFLNGYLDEDIYMV
ncbi:retrotransposon protein, putative, ty1-copia subclass [Tanacetum coccineum]